MQEKKGVFRWVVYVLAAYGLMSIIGMVIFVAANFSNLATFSEMYAFINGFSMYSIDASKAVDGAMKGVVQSTGDPWGAYLTPEEYKNMSENLSGSFGGIGIYVAKTAGGPLVVAETMKNTPAERAGIKSGDAIMKIGDQDVSLLDEDQAVSMLRGKPGTEVSITVLKSDEQREVPLTLTREVINVPSVDSRMLETNPDIGYISLKKFNSNSPEEVAKAISNVKGQGAKAIILDIRNNPGGDFESSIRIADMFLGEKVIVTEKSPSGETKSHYGQVSDSDCQLPVCLLINGYSASASEILAGALKDNERADLVGQKTFGKGVIQDVIQLFNGGALKITVEKYLTPSGKDIDGIGVDPNYEVARDIDSQTDAQMDKAIELLRQKIGPLPQPQ